MHSKILSFAGKVVPTKLKVGGFAGAAVIEAALTADDIYRFYQMWDNGTIDEDEFVELVIKRLIVALVTVAGTELGSSAGFAVGGPVGLVIGGILGNIMANLLEEQWENPLYLVGTLSYHFLPSMAIKATHT